METYDMGAGIMVVCGKKTLVLKRTPYKGDPFSGYWNFQEGLLRKVRVLMRQPLERQGRK